jgi:multidrug efflux pump subunit AcrA (membrane-fusion protein)
VRKTLRRESVQPGQIEAFEQTPLFAKLPAYVEKLHVDIGDRVEADQLLVDLFLPELKDELRQKEAALVQAQAEIELATAAVRAGRGRGGNRPSQRQPDGGRQDPRRGGCHALAIPVRADQPTGGGRLARPQTRR